MYNIGRIELNDLGWFSGYKYVNALTIAQLLVCIHIFL